MCAVLCRKAFLDVEENRVEVREIKDTREEDEAAKASAALKEALLEGSGVKIFTDEEIKARAEGQARAKEMRHATPPVNHHHRHRHDAECARGRGWKRRDPPAHGTQRDDPLTPHLTRRRLTYKKRENKKRLQGQTSRGSNCTDQHQPEGRAPVHN